MSISKLFKARICTTAVILFSMRLEHARQSFKLKAEALFKNILIYNFEYRSQLLSFEM